MRSFTGRVIKGVASRFKVATATGAVSCLARGRLKAGGDILVGDEVEVPILVEGILVSDCIPAPDGNRRLDEGLFDKEQKFPLGVEYSHTCPVAITVVLVVEAIVLGFGLDNIQNSRHNVLLNELTHTPKQYSERDRHDF